MIAAFQVPTRLSFGPGAVAEIGDRVLDLGVGRALVVTDPGVVEAGITHRVTDELVKSGVECTVFDSVEPNPSIETVLHCLRNIGPANANLPAG